VATTFDSPVPLMTDSSVTLGFEKVRGQNGLEENDHPHAQLLFTTSVLSGDVQHEVPKLGTPAGDALIGEIVGNISLYAQALGMQQANSDDLAQDVGVILMERWTTLESPKAYAICVAKRLFIRRSHTKHLAKDSSDLVAECGSVKDPVDEILAGELQEVLKEAIDTLSVNNKEAFLLSFDSESTISEVACRLGIPAERLRQRVHRARVQLINHFNSRFK
jgi:RNA polymerase sigma factor (sigma-70 family)